MTLAGFKLAALVLLATTVTLPAEAARRPKKEAAPVPPPPSVKQGVELWRAGDHAGAVAMWQPYANAGDADAMFNVGQAYKLGRAVPKDAVVARDWYRRAALKGHLPAQANLGILLFQAGEKPEAIRWLKAAADKNEMRAQYVLGVANWNGDGTPRNMTLAQGYLSRAAALGLPEAVTALANLSAAVSPIERANGLAVASSLAAGNGVPPEFAGPNGRPAPVAIASNDRFSRDQVIKPLLPVAPSPLPQAAPAPAPQSAPQSSPVSGPVSGPQSGPLSVPQSTPRPTPAPPVPVVVAQVAQSVAKPLAAVPIPKPIPATVPPVPVERPAAPPVTIVAIPASAPPTSVASPAKAPPKPVQVAVAIPKKPTGWKVQLGAFSKRAQAEAAWTDVKTKQKQLVAKTSPIYMADGNVTKLQMGPYPSKAAARDACAKIAFSGRACFVTEGP